MGKKGLKPASVGLLYRAASRSFLPHKRNEIELARRRMNPPLCRGTPGRGQAILIRYSRINKGAELLLNTQPCARLWRETPGQRQKQWAQRAVGAGRWHQGSSPRQGWLRSFLGGRVAHGSAKTWAQPECGESEDSLWLCVEWVLCSPLSPAP